MVPESEPAPELTVAEAPSQLVPAKLAYSGLGKRAWTYDFELSLADTAAYAVAGQQYPVRTDLTGDLNVAYVSCNGQEHGDESRSLNERNAMWQQLRLQHEQTPFHLLLHGGDQIYADQMLTSDPTLERWAGRWPHGRRKLEFTPEMRDAAEHWLLTRYLSLICAPDVAFLSAHVPSAMMWDDHDIMDGWGSLRQWRLDSPIGQGLFDVARRMFVLFQLGSAVEQAPRVSADSEARSFTYMLNFPRLSIVAPDLRSQRRPDEVMDEKGWQVTESLLRSAPTDAHVLFMSSVPVVGPRLSLVEWLLDWIPSMQKYEDDLRDQWQSHAHRKSWQRLLSLLAERREISGLTILSGEIHVATRGEIVLEDGSVIHQLVASGIAHPTPPRAYALALGLLASLGESPLDHLRLTIEALPGRRQRYIAERNYLTLKRVGERWSAQWTLEKSGRTPALELD